MLISISFTYSSIGTYSAERNRHPGVFFFRIWCKRELQPYLVLFAILNHTSRNKDCLNDKKNYAFIYIFNKFQKVYFLFIYLIQNFLLPLLDLLPHLHHINVI